MTLSLTCPCGARLDIDAKFAGQVINCPDCNRPLDTSPPVPEPAHTSGYALASLLLALVGAFTLVGTVAAVICGAVALSQIRRSPAELGGRRFAQAGIILGVVFTLVTVIALTTTELLRIDGLLRTIEWAGKFEDTPDEVDLKKSGVFDPGRSGTIRRPSAAWVRLTYKDPNKENTDDLVLVNLWEDAYIVCLTKWLDQPGLTLESCRQEGQQRFLQSELVTKILGAPNAPPPEGHDRDRKQLPGSETQEFLFDIRLGGVERTFLIRVLRDGNSLTVIAGGTRKNRFARLQPDLVKALDSFKMEKGS